MGIQGQKLWKSASWASKVGKPSSHHAITYHLHPPIFSSPPAPPVSWHWDTLASPKQGQAKVGSISGLVTRQEAWNNPSLDKHGVWWESMSHVYVASIPAGMLHTGQMGDLPPRMCQESCVPCLARNGNIRAPCIPPMVDPLRGAPPASSAARQEALSLRGTNRTGTQNEEWGWIKRSHVMIYRDGKGDEATQSCWTTALYTYYIHITTKSPAKRCKKYKQSRLYLLHPPDVAMKCISTAEPEGLPLALRHHIT